MRHHGKTHADYVVEALYERTSDGWDYSALGYGMSEIELTMRLWELNPQAFGLPGFTSRHPDRKAVSCLLSKMRRPRFGPVLIDRSNGRVKLSDDGVQRGRWLRQKFGKLASA